MNYLLIQNAGVAPVESYTLLGMSISRDVEGAIGQFGSGAKHAINVLLRAGLKFYIYCGKTRLEFFTVEDVVNDGLTQKTIERVMCKLGGTSTKTVDCGWCLDFGAMDWGDVSMALREFVSNAIDRSTRQGGFVEAMESGDLVVEPRADVARRAKDGYTRIYIELSKDVQTFFGELPKRFLHFDDPDKVNQRLLPKKQPSRARIYRCGVFVRELEQTKLPSLFDFNFGPNDLSIDESRNSSEYETRGACAKMMAKASAKELATVFKSLMKNEQTFESKLDAYYMCPTWSNPKTEYKVAWQDGWKAAAGDSAIVEQGMATVEMAQKKGHKVTPIQATEWVTAAKQFGIKSVDDVLTGHEREGRDKTPATRVALQAVDTVWAWFEALNMTKGKDKPRVGCFHAIDGNVDGFHEGDSVYLREEITESRYLLKVAYEEVARYVSNDYEDLLIDMFLEVAV